MSTFRRRSPLRESFGFAVIAGSFALLLVFGFVWTFSLSAGTARTVAQEKGGLTEVSSVDRQFFSWCRKNYVGYTVEGTRNGEPETLKVCVTFPKAFSYVR